jgi:formate dehydrogenase major subunit
MDKIKVIVNDKEIYTTKGKTILEVVNEFKLDSIPTLCHDERIEPYGSCFLCVVEVEGLNKLVPSCTTPVNDNMIIRTNSEKIKESRKTALELLLSNHYADCIGPCINNCPASVDAQGYIALISMGKYEEALKLIKQNNPLPLSIGRVCVRNCEDGCRRCLIDEPIAVNFLKRFVADIDQTKWKPQLEIKKGKKVAVIGGGPAGLTCTYYLLLKGYEVTLFEKLPELGGMLRYGIPEYRLPKKILDAEIKWIIDLGAEVKTGTAMGKNFTLKSLKEQGFEAIFLSVGAHKSSAMRLEGEDSIENVFSGIDFLREQEIGGKSKLTGTVIVVGGGNTAIDAARTSLRCGAGKVIIVYRRSLNEMPAHPSEIEDAQREGVEIMFLTNPKSIYAEDGVLKSIECLKMKLEEASPGERPKPVPVEGSEFYVDCDYLISAIGQQVDMSFIKQDAECKTEKWGTVIVNERTFETSIPGVFSGGDLVSGPLTAVNAIGHGKKAAKAIDTYLQTGFALNGNKKFYSFKHNLANIAISEYSNFSKLKRARMPALSLSERKNNFIEVELGMTKDQVASEATRCLECGCSEYYDCKLRQYADDFQIDITNFIGEVRKFKADRTHPFIAIDPNKCINCGKCVRTCTEILKVSALGFVNRGFRAVVKPAMEKPLMETNCIVCGNCIDVCPTGALSEKYPFKVVGTLAKTNQVSICSFCSLGCKINYKIIDHDLFYVSNSTPEILQSRNNGYLCVKGKFGHRFLMDKNKIETALILTGTKFEKTETNHALTYGSQKIMELIAKYGNDAVAVFASPKLSNEELYLIQKFARVGIKTNNISSFTNIELENEISGLDDLIGLTCSNTTIYDFEKADVIIAVNANLSDENLILELKIKQSQKNGAKLVLINSSECRLSKIADLWIDTKKGTNTILLSGLINEVIDNKASDFLKLKERISLFDHEMVTDLTEISQNKLLELLNIIKKTDANIIFIYNLDSYKEKSKDDIKAIGNFLSVTNRLDKPGNGLFLLRDYSNSTGMVDMGVTPKYLPGYVKHHENDLIDRIGKIWKSDIKNVFRPVSLLEQFHKNKIKAVIVFGEDPCFDKDNLKYFSGVEFVMAFESFQTATTSSAQVVIPLGTCIEQSGTITSCDTQIQEIKQIITVGHIKQNWEVIMHFANLFDTQWNYQSHKDIYQEIKEINRFYANMEPESFWNKSIDFQNFISENKNKFIIYDIDMTTYQFGKTPVLFSEAYFLKNIRDKLQE